MEKAKREEQEEGEKERPRREEERGEEPDKRRPRVTAEEENDDRDRERMNKEKVKTSAGTRVVEEGEKKQKGSSKEKEKVPGGGVGEKKRDEGENKKKKDGRGGEDKRGGDELTMMEVVMRWLEKEGLAGLHRLLIDALLLPSPKTGNGETKFSFTFLPIERVLSLPGVRLSVLVPCFLTSRLISRVSQCLCMCSSNPVAVGEEHCWLEIQRRCRAVPRFLFVQSSWKGTKDRDGWQVERERIMQTIGMDTLDR